MEVVRVLECIQIFLIYSICILGLGEIISRPFTRGKGVAYRFLVDLIVGNFYIINMSFLLAFLRLWYRPVIVFVLLVFACGLRYIVDKEKVTKIFKHGYEWLILVLKREIGNKYAVKAIQGEVNGRLWLLFKQLFLQRGIEVILLILMLGINMYYFSYQAIHFVSYAAPDVEVHLSWIQSLIGGELFPKGVYPFGMHCIGAILCTIFDVPAVIFARMFGVVTTFYIILVGYCFARFVCKQKYAPLFGFMIFTLANIMVETSYIRYSAMIAQEYAMIFLCPMMIFIYRYLNEKKKVDLIWFGMCISLTLAVHFYITIIAFFFCVAIGLVYFIRIVKEKMLVPILICGIMSLVIAIAPLGIGLILGYELEKSFSYGASVLTGDATLYMDESEYTEEELEEIESAPLHGFRVENTHSIKDIVQTGSELLEYYVIKKIEYIWIFIIPLLVILLNWCIRLITRKMTEYVWMQFSVLIYTLILFEQTIGSMFDWLVFIEPKRMAIFLFYIMPVLIAMFFDILYIPTAKGPRSRFVWDTAIVIATIGFAVCVYANDLEKPLPCVYYFQTKGAMLAACDIIKNYEGETWTIVSTVNENSIIENHGYHYEIANFLYDMENYKEGMSIYIPTEYVFFYVEKMPIEKYGWYFEVTDSFFKDRPKVSVEAALEELEEFNIENSAFNNEKRIQLMSRMYYWAQEYAMHFPNEMTVFYEDDEIMIYRLKQNPYALNNLAIDYRKRLLNE